MLSKVKNEFYSLDSRLNSVMTRRVTLELNFIFLSLEQLVSWLPLPGDGLSVRLHFRGAEDDAARLQETKGQEMVRTR